MLYPPSMLENYRENWFQYVYSKSMQQQLTLLAVLPWLEQSYSVCIRLFTAKQDRTPNEPSTFSKYKGCRATTLYLNIFHYVGFLVTVYFLRVCQVFKVW